MPKALLSVLAGCLLVGGTTAATYASPYVVDLYQSGANVVASGSGEIDLTGLTRQSPSSTGGAGILPSTAIIYLGLAGPADNYVSMTGPTSFGPGGVTVATAGTGDAVGVQNGYYLSVPFGYVSDTPLIDTAIWDNATLASLGVTPGTYTWTWGTGADQNFTLEISATPIPAALPLFAGGLGALGALGWRKKRKLSATA